MDKINCYKTLIAEYLEKYSNICCWDFIEYTIEQNCLKNAIRIAVMSKNRNGNLCPHQRHINKDVYDNFFQNLLKVQEKIENSKSFDELINIITDNKVTGAGELFCYDVALRIGYKLKLLPEKIYIHAGTRKGLKNLLNINNSVKTINKHDLPEPFCSCELTPVQLEDFFCVYEDRFICNKN
ncbi:hypothetical protein [Treponema sp. R80B11-R83G3]